MSFHYSLALAEEFCGMTYELLTESHGKELLTWFQGVFHAPTSPLQAKEQASKEKKVGCGQKWRGSLAKYDHSTHSLKTAQCSLLEASTQSSVTLPNWGLMQNGELLEQTISEQIIKENASGLSQEMVHTPTATANQMAPSMRKSNYWPTPSSRDHKGGYQGGRIRNGKVSRDTLDVAVQHTDNKEKTGGQLNLMWVEWLMGWPLGHTDLKPVATDKFQKWLELHGKY